MELFILVPFDLVQYVFCYHPGSLSHHGKLKHIDILRDITACLQNLAAPQGDSRNHHEIWINEWLAQIILVFGYCFNF